MAGVTTGLEGLANWGAQGVDKQQVKQQQYAQRLTDWKDVDGVWSFIDFMGNQTAQALPYMGITLGATFAAPITGGASFAAPVSLYTGMTWNEMEGEKSASAAVAGGVLQAVLDRVGIGGLYKVGVPPKKLINEAIEKLVKEGTPRGQAQEILANATKTTVGELAKDISGFAAKQLKAKELVKSYISRAGASAGLEAGTEAAQEAIGYTAAVVGSDKVFDFDELQDRMIAGAIAGGTLGGVFSVPGAAVEHARLVDQKVRASTDVKDSASTAEKYRQEEIERHGEIASIGDITVDARDRANADPESMVNLNDRIDTGDQARGAKPKKDVLIEEALNVKQWFEGSTGNIFTQELQAKSRAGRKLADMFGGNLQRIFSGSSFESQKFHNVAKYKNMIPIPDSVFTALNGGKPIKGWGTTKKKAAVSKEIYSVLNSAIDKDGKFDPNAVPEGEYKAIYAKLGLDLTRLGEKMWADQKKYNPELGHIDNYLMRYKGLNKKAIYKNQKEFKEKLQQQYKFSATEASELTDAILDNGEVNDISAAADQAFSVTKGGIVPGSHRERSLNMSEDPVFDEFMDQDLFSNISSAVKSAARYTAHQQYIGKDGAVIARLLQDMVEEGVPEAEVNEVARRLKNYLDAESGNYKRPKTKLGKQAHRLQQHVMLVTTLGALPLATITSLVELGLSAKGLRADQIWGKKGSLQAIGSELTNALTKSMDEISIEKEKTGLTPFDKETNGRKLLQELGYYEWDVGAATVTGVSETNTWQRGIYEAFFSAIGLKQYTDYTRAVRASLAADYMHDKADLLIDAYANEKPRTREIQQAEEALSNLGINVPKFVEVMAKSSINAPLTEAEAEFMAETYRESTSSFINDAVALPGSANRPLIYQDPRFALFTQFQGFMATFTANHIPKLWGEYVKRCLLYTSPSPRDRQKSRMPSSA